MNIERIVRVANDLADELEPTDIVIEFMNDAIARINIETGANYQTYTEDDVEEEIPIPEKWVRALVIPFTVGRLKQRDSSQFEYTDAYQEFLENLDMFKVRYEIPDEYKDESDTMSSGIASDVYETPAYPWWRW